MAKLEHLKKGASVEGVLPNIPVTVVDVRWHGSNVVELTYRDATGGLGSELIFRDREPSLTITAAGTPWAFDSDGELFRLVSEAYRIRASLGNDARAKYSLLFPKDSSTVRGKKRHSIIISTKENARDGANTLRGATAKAMRACVIYWVPWPNKTAGSR